MSQIEYEEDKIKDYLIANNFSTEQKRLIFKFRTHMLEFSGNYSRSNPNGVEDCPLCGKHLDDQELIPECEYLNSKYEKADLENLEKLFSDQIQMKYVKLLQQVMMERIKQ